MFFGDIVAEKMQLSSIGKITKKFWLAIPAHFSFIKLDQFIIMPNHLHGIIEINNQESTTIVGTGHCPVPTQCPVPTDKKQHYSTFGNVLPKSISTIIGSFKSVATRTINLKLPKTNFGWQTRFYDRIIRNEDELSRIREYIIDNPKKWENDQDNISSLRC